MPICRLCLNDKSLCKSHIYPEYMYAHCYDDGHSFIEFNAEAESYNKKRRKGIYEKLLCRECEGIIQRYEDYAKGILYEKAKPYINENKKSYINMNYDYTTFKLFVLSLLWRASVSSQDSFKNADLGKYEEELRKILLLGLETPVNRFPSYIYQTYIDEKPSDGVFMEMYPSKSKADGKTIYQFVADGLFFFVGVGILTIKTFHNGSSVSPESLRIGFDQLPKLVSFVDLFARLHHQGKFGVYENRHDKGS